MTLETRLLVYPEGDTQEIPHTLRFNQVVDINGRPLRLPLPTVKMIAYRVGKISTKEERGERTVSYHLDLLRRNDMIEISG
jgi:hypothetical protein